VTVTVGVEDPITSTAQVTASLVYDPDSTPANNDPTEDDQRRAPVAQRIERRPPEPKVAGSNPVGRAIATCSGKARARPWA
jgi:hypothetical protein